MRIAVLSTYPPVRCGIATYTSALLKGIAVNSPATQVLPIEVRRDRPRAGERPTEYCTIVHGDPSSYLEAVDYVHNSQADVVAIQHEFGIFGGPAGAFLLRFVRNLRVPIVTTLHTIPRWPSPLQWQVIQELATVSTRLIALSDSGGRLLCQIYGQTGSKVDVLRHGVPVIPLRTPGDAK